jgi:hypothetical protein
VQNLIQFGKFRHDLQMGPTCCGRKPELHATLTGKTMKKFSTAGFILAFASALVPLTAAAQAADKAAAPATDKTPSQARCEFLQNAPDQHKVVRGDTLWGISGKFLQHPWCWPQVWGLNRDQISNPHWIYPGQIVYFDRAAGRLRLGTAKGSQGGTADVRLSPQVRMEGLEQDVIPSIPTSAIEPFLSQPLAVDENALASAPRIVAVQEGRVMISKGEKAYVRGDLKDGKAFQVFRPGKPLRDPDTQAILAYEATYLGTIRLDRAGKTDDEAHRFIVAKSKEEMGVGDRMVAVPPTPVVNYMPHAPAAKVAARIVGVYGGVAEAGQYQIVSINRGSKDGMDVGTVLSLYRYGATIVDRTDGKRDSVKLPEEYYGNLFVFRIFNNISYGLIMQVTDVVQVGDVARSPE